MPSSTPRPFRPSRLLQSIPPYVFWDLEGRKAAHREAGRTLLDLGIGSPDQPVPEEVLAHCTEAIARRELSRYPHFRGHPELFGAFAEYAAERFGIALDPTREMLSVAGSKEGLTEVVLAVCEPGDVVLIPAIYYPVYVRATQLAGAEPVFVPFRDDGSLDLDAIPAAQLARARVLIANYPCNPTTATLDLAGVERLVAFAQQHGLLLISDLAYAELGFDGYRAPSALEVPGALDCTVELHTASKSFCMASFRVGLVVGNADVLNALDVYRTNTGYGNASLPQIAAAAAFRAHTRIVPPIVAEYQARRDALVDALRAGGWPVNAPRATMYLWLPVPDGLDDWQWVEHCMAHHGVVVTPGSAFGAAGQGRFRISLVQPPEQLREAAHALTRAASGVLA
ncbi:MAG: aminotransferase class I/II-fold pyridoxal phosphate-dependent enzyme [Gemmatimonadaceae bacterium]|nr:aminotransferase class I/II-fold pyridoxal phosphate-dependent enzyme [Gemmatimonadaceae bacterium]